jgi:uncharacterized protein YjbJ (UPF0337 family)
VGVAPQIRLLPDASNSSLIGARLDDGEAYGFVKSLVWAPNVLVKHYSARDSTRSATKDNKMPNSTRQQLEGKLHEVKGDAKKKAGELTNDPALEAEGRTEKIAGTVQKKLGEIEKLVGK